MKKFLAIICVVLLITPISFSQQSEQLKRIPKGNSLASSKIKRVQLKRTEKIEKVIYHEDFNDHESFQKKWTSQGVWQVGKLKVSKSKELNVVATGIHENYKNSISDVIISPSFNLPDYKLGEKILKLYINETYQTETDYDFLYIKISIDEGKTWTLLDRKHGNSNWQNSEYYLNTYRGKKVKIAFQIDSDSEVSFPGWFIDDIKVVLCESKKSKTRGINEIEIDLTTLNSSTFPFIYLDANVTFNDNGIFNLDKSNFTVFENSIDQVDFFEVYPPTTSGGIRLVDIIFVLDVTGSMSEELETVKNNIYSFINELEIADIDYAIGLISYTDNINIENNGNFYIQSTISDLSAKLASLEASGGADYPEATYCSIQEASRFNFRAGSQRIAIFLTDAESHNAPCGISRDDLINSHILPNNVNIYPVFDTGNSGQNNQYIPLAINPTNMYFNIYDELTDIIIDIIDRAASTYRIVYKSSDPTFNAIEREVDLNVSYLGSTDNDVGHYTPGGYPVIIRTEQTAEYDLISHTAGNQFLIEVNVTDDRYPFVHTDNPESRVTLFYRHVSSSDFQNVTMTTTDNLIWSAIIPSSVAIAPGLEYYITATDGDLTSSNPVHYPYVVAHQIVILNNYRPVITHVPIENFCPNSSILFDADVYDITENVDRVKLYYRYESQLTFQEVDMSFISGNTYSATINTVSNSNMNIEYCIYAWDNNNIRADVGSFDNPLLIYISPSCNYIRSDKNDICLGDEVNLEFNSAYSNEIHWYFDGCPDPPVESQVIGQSIHYTSPIVPFTVYAREKIDGAWGDICYSLEIIESTATDYPVVDNHSLTICPGDNTELLAQTSEQELFWFEGECLSDINLALSSPVVVNPIVNTSYFVRAGNCAGLSNCLQVDVSVYPLPIMSYGPIEFVPKCNPGEFDITFDEGTAPWSFKYTIDNGEEKIVEAPSSPFTFVIEESGEYQFYDLTDANECISAQTFEPFQVDIVPCPGVASLHLAECYMDNINLIINTGIVCTDLVPEDIHIGTPDNSSLTVTDIIMDPACDGLPGASGSVFKLIFDREVFADGYYPVTIDGPFTDMYGLVYDNEIAGSFTLANCGDDVLECKDCISGFSPLAGEKYILNAWTMEEGNAGLTDVNSQLVLVFEGTGRSFTFTPNGTVIDGWQQINGEFEAPANADAVTVKLVNLSPQKEVYFDDIRIFPVDGTMKSYVYDPVSMKLMAELDENNYATFYEYDEEGRLIRIKRETERGIVTIQENSTHMNAVLNELIMKSNSK